MDPEDEGTELIPEGWNTDTHGYALRYLYHNQLYILHGTISEDSIIMNFLVSIKWISSNTRTVKMLLFIGSKNSNCDKWNVPHEGYSEEVEGKYQRNGAWCTRRIESI